MSLQLKIDTNALMTLFPEGSEARLQLQQAVLSEVAKRTLKGITQQELVNALHPAVAEIKKEVLKDYGELEYVNNKWQLIPSKEFRKAVQDVVRDEIFSFLGKEVQEYLEGYLAHKVRMLGEEAIKHAQLLVNKTYEQNFQQRLAKINKLSQGIQP